MKIIISNTDVGSLLKATDSILKKYGNNDDVPDNIKGQATLSALKSNFSNSWFSVCELNDMCKMNDVRISEEKMSFFQTLHCVKFSDMTEETRAYLFASLEDIFRSNITMANAKFTTLQ